MKVATLLIGVGAVLLHAGTAQAGTTYRVGSGCTYSTIQAAVNAIPDQGSGIIRIRAGTYVENLVINNKTVELLGGHNDCTTTSATSISHIDASGGVSPVITYRVNLGPAGTSHSLFTNRMNLFDGTGIGTAPGGGISVYTAVDRTASITLERTFVRNNQTSHVGGGIALRGEGSGSLALLENSQIENNSVTGTNPHGGGLYCQGDYSILMIGGSIHGNTAGQPGDTNARGGGIYLDGCDLDWFAQNQLATVDDAALRNNTAYGGGFISGGSGGGGLYATGGAQVELIGAHLTFGTPISSRPLRIHNNRALATSTTSGSDIGAGSAVFATGAGTLVRLDRTWTYNNQANGWATFETSGGAQIVVERGSEVCHTPRNCSRVFDNSGGVTVVAGAHGANSAVRFRRTIVSGNASTNSANITSSFENQFGGTVEIDDSLVIGNSSTVGFHVYQDGSPVLRVRRSTIADNNFDNSFPTFSSTVFRITGDNSTLALWDSIVHEPGTDLANDFESFWSPTIAIDCVVWHSDQLSGFRATVADPMFVDPDNGLYYLQPGSPAINYCDVTPPAPAVDINWNSRGISHSGQPDLHGPYDLGAIEFPLTIFSDRFENP